MDENENSDHRPVEEPQNQDEENQEKDNVSLITKQTRMLNIFQFLLITIVASFLQVAFDLEDEISEDEADDEEEGQDDERPNVKTKKKKRRSTFIDDAAEDDEDTDRRLKRSRFIDDIAEVDDEDEDDDFEDEGMDDLIADEGEVPDEVDLAEVRRAHREAEMQLRKEEEINPEALQEYLKERFSRERVAAYRRGEEADASGAVAQQALMPSVRDPKLWVVRCAEGAEREIVICLLQKCYDYTVKGQPLLIKSAFAKDQLKGYIYVEAYKDAHVREALKGLRSIFASKPPKLVPLGEMVSAVTVIKTTGKTMLPGSWVRVKAGVYKGDLAQVEDVDVNAGRAIVKLVPRIDYAAMAERRASADPKPAGFTKQPKMRPPPRAFRADEAHNFKLDVQQQRDRATGDMHYILGGSQRFSKGYLIKTVALKSISLETTLPPLDELQGFNSIKQDDDDGGGARGGAGAADDGLDGLAQLVVTSDIDAAQTKYEKGDVVIVIDGDLKGIKGRVERITEDNQIMILPTDESLEGFTEAIGFTAREISKYFESGDHVKVVNGSHSGETGMVVRVEGPVCYIFTDATKEEIKAFSRDLTETAAAATTIDSIGDYDLFDLVLLDSSTVGVIVNVEKDSCKVLTNQGRPEKPNVRICRLPDLKRKINNRRATAIDGARNEVSVGDIAEILEGPLRQKSGTVKHIMRGFLFIQSKQLTENGGFVAVHARQTKVRGGKHVPGSHGNLLTTPSRALATPSYGANVLASPAHHGAAAGGGAAGGGYAGRTSTQQDRLLEGREVVIKKGPYRGMSGKIKNATGSHVRVELQAQMKTVTVSREHLSMADGGVQAQRPASMGMGMGMGMAAPGGRTPAHWSGGVTATPGHYSAMATSTPMHPGLTPGRDAVTKTPAYDPAWTTATPVHPGFGSSMGGGMMGFGAASGGGFGGGYGGSGYNRAVQQYQPPSNQVQQQEQPSLAAAEPESTVEGPLPESRASDWVGLEVVLSTGEHAVVRSISAATGDMSVQIGKELDGGKGYVFKEGSVRGVNASEVKLPPCALGDTVMVFAKTGGGVRWNIALMEANEVFVKQAGSEDIQVVQAGKIAKVAVDAVAA